MAVTLTLKGPGITDVTASASNVKALAIMDDWLEHHEEDVIGMTDQQKAQAFMDHLVEEVVAVHRSRRERAAAAAAAMEDWTE